MTDSDVRRLEDKVDGLALTLARLEGSLAPTLESLTAKQDSADLILDDHEKRLRSLEKFRYGWPSVALISVLIGAVTLAYYLMNGG